MQKIGTIPTLEYHVGSADWATALCGKDEPAQADASEDSVCARRARSEHPICHD